MTLNLLSPMLDEAPQYTHYFNGRLLTAEDLRTDQTYTREQRAFLGRGLGSGIVDGLEVTSVGSASAPRLEVSVGFGINPEGQVLALNKKVQLALTQATNGSGGSKGSFGECGTPDVTATLTGTGVYFLVMGPSAGYKEKAPKVSGDGSASFEGCGARYAVDGVYFNLVSYDIADFFDDKQVKTLAQWLDLNDLWAIDRLRNGVAHECLGSAEKIRMAMDPTAAFRGDSNGHYGAVEAHYDSGAIDSDEIPLALILWTDQGIVFCDMFAVRRQPVPASFSTHFEPALGRRGLMEAQAAWHQFQTQLEAIPAASRPMVNAASWFDFLPPLGILPSGFDPATFFAAFSGWETMMQQITPDQVVPMLRQSFDYQPFTAGKKMIRVYQVVIYLRQYVVTGDKRSTAKAAVSDVTMLRRTTSRESDSYRFSRESSPVIEYEHNGEIHTYTPAVSGRVGLPSGLDIRNVDPDWLAEAGEVEIDTAFPQPAGNDQAYDLYYLFTTPFMPAQGLNRTPQ